MVLYYVAYVLLGLSATNVSGYFMARLIFDDMDTERLKSIRKRMHGSKFLRGLSHIVGLHYGVDRELKKREVLRREVIKELKHKGPYGSFGK